MSRNFFKALAAIALISVIGCAAGPEVAAPGGPMKPQEFIFGTVWFFLMALFVYYVLVLNPARLREDDRKKFISGLQKNDEVLTASGILGRVVSVKSDYITVEIAPNVKVKIASRYVLPVPSEASSGAEETKSAKATEKKKQG